MDLDAQLVLAGEVLAEEKLVWTGRPVQGVILR